MLLYKLESTNSPTILVQATRRIQFNHRLQVPKKTGGFGAKIASFLTNFGTLRIIFAKKLFLLHYKMKAPKS